MAELDSKLSYQISQEMHSLSEKNDLEDLTKQYGQIGRSCLECHEKKTHIIQERMVFLRKLSAIKNGSSQTWNNVNHILSELTDSVSYIHEHHIATLKNLLKRNKVQEESDLNGVPYRKSSTHSAPELDIIRITVDLQRHLAILSGNFYSLYTTLDPVQLQAEFQRNIDSLIKTINTFDDYSLDAQDGLLVEELLESSRAFKLLFTTLVDLEKTRRTFRKNLQDNHGKMVATLSEVEKQIRTKRDTLKKQSILLERCSFLFVVLLIILIFLRSREIIRSLNGIVVETEKIQDDLSYRIQEDPAMATEFQVISHALNKMTQKIDRQTRKLHREITVRIKTEQNLTTEKERLAVTLRSIGDGVITTDTKGRIVFINNVAEQLTGWNNNDAQGRPSPEVFKIINEKTGEKCASPVSRVLDDN